MIYTVQLGGLAQLCPEIIVDWDMFDGTQGLHDEIISERVIEPMVVDSRIHEHVEEWMIEFMNELIFHTFYHVARYWLSLCSGPGWNR